MPELHRAATLALAAACASTALASSALADVQRQGEWPEDEKTISLALSEQPRSAALKSLAEKADWDLVFRGPRSEPVDVHVTDQPPSRVLELLLDDGDWIATREGSLVSVKPAPARGMPAGVASSASPTSLSHQPASPPEPPEPAAEKAPTQAPDRTITGGSFDLAKGEVVHDLVILGGRAHVRGHVTGDLVVMGGSALVHDGAVVDGDATALGGRLRLEDGSRVLGDVGVVGGALERGDAAHVEGDVTGDSNASTSEERESRFSMSQLIESTGDALTSSALLFVFGAVLMALATRRMDRLKLAVAEHPMRTFALGVVGLIASVALLVALAVTVIGIPVAIVALFVAIFAAYGGICAVLTTVGGLLVSHRTHNEYVHLGVGCVLFLILGAIPWLGEIVTWIVVLLGVGSLVATRGAGFVKSRRRLPEGDAYRTSV